MSEWISVETQMPPNGEAVLVWCAGSECPGVAWWRGTARGWIIPEPQAIGAESITHWMPLPAPPSTPC